MTVVQRRPCKRLIDCRFLCARGVHCKCRENKRLAENGWIKGLLGAGKAWLEKRKSCAQSAKQNDRREIVDEAVGK